MQHSFQMGQRVRDKVTQFSGVITGMCQHITGCDTIGVNPGVDKDGVLREVQWFDWTRLELLDATRIMAPVAPAVAGGPQDHPHTI